MNVALVGFGTVGQSVARILAETPGPIRVTHVCNRRVARKRADWMASDVCWTEDFDDVLAAPVDAIVELMGGLEPAGTWVRRALASGRSVVTANKQLIAQQGAELFDLAAAHGCHLAFEASVAGGIPVIRALREGLAGDRLYRVSGILNGTCNYILTRMESAGIGFAEALAEAQASGYAEADPTEDVDGLDARAKLCILARVGLLCDVRPGEVSCGSIRPIRDIDFVYARRLACTIRQISRVDRDEHTGAVTAWVRPALVANRSPLARVEGSRNLVVVAGRFGGETAFSGFGAGGSPTAVAVVSDLLAIAARGRGPAGERVSSVPRPPSVSDALTAPYYLRFVVHDRPGIIASLARELSAHEINIDAVLQEPGGPKQALPFVVTLEACAPAQLEPALARIAAYDFHVEAPLALPVLA